MMKRNRFGTSIVVTCDAPECSLAWTYDAPAATFSAARAAAARAGWACERAGAWRRDTCRWCRDRGREAA